MTTTLSIGRARASTERKVQSLRRTGNRITIGGVWFAGSFQASEDAAEQLASLVGDPDSAVVPVVWGGTSEADARMTGFYRVLDVSVDGVAGQAGSGVQAYNVTLERVQGFAAPLFESTIQGSIREQIEPPTLPEAWMALPASVAGYEVGVDLTPSFSNRMTAEGPVTVFSNPGNTLFNARPSFFVPPEEWYVGAATLKVGGRVVVGRQVPNDPQGWEMSNGLVRVSATQTAIAVTGFVDGAWGLPMDVGVIRWDLVASAASPVTPPHTITVVRNSPEEVVLRLTMDGASATPGARFAVYMDLSLRRGSKTVAVRISSRGLYAWGMRVGGFLAPWDSGANGVWTPEGRLIMRDVYAGVLGVAGGVRVQSLSNGRPFVGGLGYCSPAAASGTVDHPTRVCNQWAAYQSEKTQVVAR